MPIMKCKLNNKPGYRWGISGQCYTWEIGDKDKEKEAYNKARKQGIAIIISRGK